MDLFRRPEPILQNRDLLERPEPIPHLRIRDLTPDLSNIEKRASSSSSSDDSSSSSGGGSDTTPIVIGVVIPVVIVAIIMFVIWKRRRTIVAHEKANDKYKSLDFGIDESGFAKKGRKGQGPEMSVADLKGELRKDKGMSLDLGTSSPYLLPPEVHQSRESLHSLSRNMNTGDDKYRATNFIPDDGSIRSPSSMRSHGDNSSIWTGSTRQRTGTMDTESKTDLLPRVPPTTNVSQIAKPLPALEKPGSGLLLPGGLDVDRHSTLSTTSDTTALRASNNYLGQYISGGQKAASSKTDDQPGLIVSETEVTPTSPGEGPRELPAAVIHNDYQNNQRASSVYDSNQVGHAIAELPGTYQEPTLPQIATTTYEMDATTQSQFPKRTQSVHAKDNYNESAYAADTQHPPVPDINVQHHQSQTQAQVDDDDASDYYDEEAYEDYQDYLGYTYRGSMMGVRPLPPDDPAENPEQRANRIRSFYKEYFDDSGKGNRTTNYYDGSEAYEQYDDFDYGYYEQSHSRGPSIRSDGRHRAFSHGNHGYYPGGGPRAFSSMSGRMGPPRKMVPKKKLPPPKPLMVLPTPHKLKEDDFLPNAIDFAPPQIFKNQRSGTPDSLRGGLRPYSPSVRPHVPLQSAFDDLAVVPSPHALRKSGTFTALDFAPPRRFKEPGETMSETGSIRSNRSNVSKMQLANIRNGAYRVSRIPKDVAGTRDDMFMALKPKWDMRGDGAATPTLR